ncbi:MAG: lytic murein transglycosylase, partial [Luteimonas sp.]
MPRSSTRARACQARLALVIASLACTCAVHAQSSDTLLRSAIDAAERGDAVTLSPQHPAYGWVEYAGLRRHIDTLPVAQGQAFLARYNAQAVAGLFRETWLAALAKRQDWTAFRAAWSPSIESSALRCAELDARQRSGATDARWTQDALALWRASGGKPLPAECDAPFETPAARSALTPALRWERIDKAAGDWQPAVMRHAARGLPADELALANDYAAFFDAVNDRALHWPKTPRSRLIASQGLARLAKSTPIAAEQQLPKFAGALGFSDAERGRVLY